MTGRHVTIRVPAQTGVADYLAQLAEQYGWQIDVDAQLEVVARVDLSAPHLDVLLAQLIDRAGELPVTVCYQVDRPLTPDYSRPLAEIAPHHDPTQIG